MRNDSSENAAKRSTTVPNNHWSLHRLDGGRHCHQHAAARFQI